MKRESWRSSARNTKKQLTWILKLVAVGAGVDDEEREAECDEHEDKGQPTLGNPLRDGVEHDAEPASEEGNSSWMVKVMSKVFFRVLYRVRHMVIIKYDVITFISLTLVK